jgi:hypothetical protein
MRRHTQKSGLGAFFVCIALALGACGGDDGGGDTANGTPPPASNNPAPPVISGTPQPTAMVGMAYTFQPTASSPSDSGTLTFSIAQKPAWAGFNTTNGRLSGTPAAADVGTYQNIVISASNSVGTTSLSAFSIEVVATGQFSTTLSWTPPTANEDGTTLQLAGYRIRYGQNPGSYGTVITVASPGLASYVVDGLVAGTYHFVDHGV